MPLADNSQAWFDSDAGEALPPRRRPRQADGYTDPTYGNALPGTIPANVPTFAPCWDAPTALMRPHAFRPAIEPASDPKPPATGAIELAWPDTATPIRPRPWRPAQDSPALGLLPPGMGAESPAQEIASQDAPCAFRRRIPWRPAADAPGLTFPVPGIEVLAADWLVAEVLAHSRRPWRASEVLDIVPIWTWGTGQPVPPLSWGMDSGAALPTRRARVSQETAAAPPFGAVSDIPVTLIGWRYDAPPMRWCRPAFHAQEIAGLPPLSFVLDVSLIDVAALTPPPPLARARHWQATPADDMAAALWESHVMRVDSFGHVVWDVQQTPLRPVARFRATDPGAAPILDATALLAVPWLPTSDGSRQMRRVPWVAAIVDNMTTGDDATVWASSGGVVIAGPFYAEITQIWQPGAEELEMFQ